jgi:hypothetical protein
MQRSENKNCILGDWKESPLFPNDNDDDNSTNFNSSLQLTKNTFTLIELYSVNTRNKQPLTFPEKNVQYTGINIFNDLPHSLKSFMNGNAQFKVEVKKYLDTNWFYSNDEFLLSEEWKSS